MLTNYWSVSNTAKTNPSGSKIKTAKFQSQAVSRPRPWSRGLHLWR